MADKYKFNPFTGNFDITIPEVDTIDSVTSRGNTTLNAVSMSTVLLQKTATATAVNTEYPSYDAILVGSSWNIGSTVPIDTMEYATDGAAQTAWVSSNTTEGYTIDQFTGGTPFGDTPWSGSVAGAFDDNPGTYWEYNESLPAYIGYDLGSGVTKIARQVTLQNYSSAYCARNLTVQGSNNGVDYDDLYDIVDAPRDADVHSYQFSNSTAYRYYRFKVTAYYTDATIKELEMMEYNDLHLQTYSEDTIVNEGTYSLKAVAAATISLNDTLTYTPATAIDLTDKNVLALDIYAARTGSNLTISLVDSGGTTSIKTITVNSADTWETKSIDISDVANADKDEITSIVITISNADAENTFYLDNMYGSTTQQENTGKIHIRNVATGNLSIPKYDLSILDNNLTEIASLKMDIGLLSVSTLTLSHVSTNGAITLTSSHYQLDCTANSFTVTLPTSSTVAGQQYSIKNSGAGIITVDGSGAETIDGVATQELYQYENMQIISDGTKWSII